MLNQFDVFISHASEDKETIARPLALKLTEFGARVWFDEFTLEVGDSLSRSIDRGLAMSRYGVVVLSKAFVSKGWPEYELRGLVTKEVGDQKVILPIWHQISKDEIASYSPTLADKVALDSSKISLEELALQILRVVRPDIFDNLYRYLLWKKESMKGTKEYSAPENVRPGPIRHKTLPDQFLVRAKIIQKNLEDVLPISLDDTIENFQRDLHPAEELAIWEKITAAYLDMISGQDMSFEERKKIISALIYISMEDQEGRERILQEGDVVMVHALFTYVRVIPRMPKEKNEAS